MDCKLISLFLIFCLVVHVEGAMRAHMRHLGLKQVKTYQKKEPVSDEKCQETKGNAELVEILNIACEHCPTDSDILVSKEECESNCWDNYGLLSCAANALQLGKIEKLPELPYSN